MKGNFHQILAVLELTLGRHLANAHQFSRLHDVGVHSHTGGSDDCVALSIVDDKLGLRQITFDDNVVPAADGRRRVAAVPHLATESRPKDGRGEWRRGVLFDNVVGSGAASVLRNVPVLDAGVLAFAAAGAVVRERGNVADGVDVLEAGHEEVFVSLEGAVFFEAHDAVLAQVLGSRGDADAKNDQIGVEFGAVLQVDASDVGWVGSRRVGFFDRGAHVELDTFAFEDGLDGRADLLAEDALQRHFFHADDSHGIVCTGCSGDFHADKRGTNHHNVLALVGSDGVYNLLDVVDVAQREDVAQHAEALHGQQPRRTARGEDQLRVRDAVAAALCGYCFGGKVDTVHFAVYPGHGARVKPALVAPLDLARVRNQRLAELGPVNGQVSLVGDDCDFARVALFPKTFDRSNSSRAAANYNHAVVRVVGRRCAAEVGLSFG